ncbi:hypothetical protein AXG93_154s1290 [Marchantia polymorpha subsp. ruderalis]|uniref:Uncharacterized protein n=1 Tax=Marchantia polymorpha subsp. ruderalis TaxID=1480154 RepID=A0A176VL32_MARPO|nr:hypothetical protein AXG93_154s1290 [Marchantia polymorpha subsp. ruderalis]
MLSILKRSYECMTSNQAARKKERKKDLGRIKHSPPQYCPVGLLLLLWFGAVWCSEVAVVNEEVTRHNARQEPMKHVAVAEELDSRESNRNDEEEATAARGLDELDREDCRESPNKVYGGLVPPWDRGIKEMRSLDRGVDEHGVREEGMNAVRLSALDCLSGAGAGDENRVVERREEREEGRREMSCAAQ